MGSTQNQQSGQTIPRDRSKDMVLQQIGWLGQTGTFYTLDAPPTREQEPGSFGPVYKQIGVWEHLGDGHFGIKD
ncbi:hypothetical protein [Nocardia wallacei]|uniref:hypothetical protein n=1 Tax=Nocardia wallacei TaxID=480035 RepID=UPI0024575A3F|nr:hypothetical protein [Nocardia wallacei]